MNRHPAQDVMPEGRFSCLTEMSSLALVAGALGFSAVLWVAILAVL
ncbi:hypothetical protein [Roseibium sp.]